MHAMHWYRVSYCNRWSRMQFGMGSSGLCAQAHRVRSALVNLDRVAEMRQWSSGDSIVVLKTGGKLKLSRSYRQNVEAGAR
jgi:hypothetical protein